MQKVTRFDTFHTVYLRGSRSSWCFCCTFGQECDEGLLLTRYHPLVSVSAVTSTQGLCFGHIAATRIFDIMQNDIPSLLVLLRHLSAAKRLDFDCLPLCII